MECACEPGNLPIGRWNAAADFTLARAHAAMKRVMNAAGKSRQVAAEACHARPLPTHLECLSVDPITRIAPHGRAVPA